MTNYDNDYNDTIDNDGEGQDGPAGLRNALKAKDKELKELRAQLETLTKESRQRKVSESLSAKGLPAKLAGLIPQDADVDEWLGEYGELFGGKSDDGEAASQTAEGNKPSVADEVANAWEQVSQTTQQGVAPDAPKVSVLEAQLAKHVAEGGDIGEFMKAHGLTQQWG